MNKLLYLIFISTMFSCELGDSSMETKEELIGDFVIITDSANNPKSGVVLAFESSPNTYNHISELCEEVVFDSNQILVKRTFLTTEYAYDKIDILSLHSSKSRNKLEYRIETIDSIRFEEFTDSCIWCEKRNWGIASNRTNSR